jgi:hypothetical protein
LDDVNAASEVRSVPAGRVLRLLGLGMLLVAIVDVVAVVAIVGWIEGARSHPGRTPGSNLPILWGAVGALAGVAGLALVGTLLVIVILLLVRARRGTPDQ